MFFFFLEVNNLMGPVHKKVDRIAVHVLLTVILQLILRVLVVQLQAWPAIQYVFLKFSFCCHCSILSIADFQTFFLDVFTNSFCHVVHVQTSLGNFCVSSLKRKRTNILSRIVIFFYYSLFFFCHMLWTVC